MEKEFYARKAVILPQLVLSFIFFIFFGLMFIHFLQTEINLTQVIFFGVGLIGVAFIIISFIGLLLQNTPIVTIDEDGITKRMYKKEPEFIPWEDIVEAGINNNEQDYLFVKTKSNDNTNPMKGNRLKIKLGFYDNVKMEIPQLYLSKPLVEVLDALKCDKHLLFFHNLPHVTPIISYPIDEMGYIKKAKHLEKKSKKRRLYGIFKRREVVMYFIYLIDRQIIEQGSYAYLNSDDQYSLWVSIDSLQEAESGSLLSLAQELQVLRNSSVSDTKRQEICQMIDTKWTESSEKAIDLAINYWNKSI